MQMIQYDMLYGENYSYGEAGKHEPAEFHMGIIDQVIDRVVQVEDKVYVFGENFTTQSKVHINGDFVSTGFINENLIRVKDRTLEDGDEVQIKQLAPNKRVLSEEMSIIYEIPTP